MPKRKYPFFSDPRGDLKLNVSVNASDTSHTGRCDQTENKEHLTYQGWDHIGDAFKEILCDESEEEIIEQASISSIRSQLDNIPSLINSLDKDSNVEISSQSSDHHCEESSFDKNDADSCINSTYSPSLPSKPPNGSQSSLFSVECSSDNESVIIIDKSDGPFIAKDLSEDISDQSMVLTPSPKSVNEAFYFSSQTSESEHSLGMDSLVLNQENDTASISSGSASPNRQNAMKGSDWLHSVFSKMPENALQKLDDENLAVEKPSKECFKKMSVIKGGLAEKLQNILLDLNADDALKKRNNPSDNLDLLQIRIHDMAVFNGCHVVADCENVTSTTKSPSNVEIDMPVGHTLALVLTNNLVQRWTICNGCILSILPTWQILHVSALRKSFILCPSVTNITHTSDTT